LTTTGIEEIILFRLFGVSEGSTSLFISDSITTGFLQLTLRLQVESSTKGVLLELSSEVNSSTKKLVLTGATFGWYFLIAKAVVDLRYPFGFSNLSGSYTVVVCFSSGFFLLFFRSNVSLSMVESPSE
jgi:hypothetical protein